MFSIKKTCMIAATAAGVSIITQLSLNWISYRLQTPPTRQKPPWLSSPSSGHLGTSSFTICTSGEELSSTCRNNPLRALSASPPSTSSLCFTANSKTVSPVTQSTMLVSKRRDRVLVPIMVSPLRRDSNTLTLPSSVSTCSTIATWTTISCLPARLSVPHPVVLTSSSTSSTDSSLMMMHRTTTTCPSAFWKRTPMQLVRLSEHSSHCSWWQMCPNRPPPPPTSPSVSSSESFLFYWD